MKLNHKNKQNRNTKNGEMGIFISSKKNVDSSFNQYLCFEYFFNKRLNKKKTLTPSPTSE